MKKTVKNYLGEELIITDNTILCDSDKLAQIFRERGLIEGDVSEKIGFNRTTVRNARKRGALSGAIVNGLKRDFNIYPEDYEYKQPVEEPKGPEQTQDQDMVEGQTVMDMDSAKQDGFENKLYEAVRRGVADGMKEIFGNGNQELRNLAYTSMLCALRKDREIRKQEAHNT